MRAVAGVGRVVGAIAVCAGVLLPASVGSHHSQASAPRVQLAASTARPECRATAGAITAGPDGNLWFADPGDGAMGRVTPGGSVTAFPITGVGDVNELRPITVGPDGALWSTESHASRIDRVTTTGAVTQFPVSTSAGLFAITAGPDGNVWFTLSDGHVGRITPAGVITLFPLAFGPSGIAPGTDGRLWVSGSKVVSGPSGPIETAHVAAITTSGVITDFVDPTTGAQSGPENNAVVGADGNVWYAFVKRTAGNGAAQMVGRITPSGAITDFAVPSSGVLQYISAIGAAPDGRIWLAVNDDNPRFVAITATGIGVGSMTAYQPAGGVGLGALGLGAGPDGNLWFGVDNNVGRIATDGTGGALFPVPAALAVTCEGSLQFGRRQGGDAITLTGRGFTGATAVKFGDISAPSFTVVSDQRIDTVTPAHAPGFFNVSVTTPGGPGISHVLFEFLAPPTVTDVCPGGGARTGGTDVIIDGRGMEHATTVHFGGKAVPAMQLPPDKFGNITDLKVEAIAPPWPTTGTVNITVTNPSGSSTVSTNSKYRYLPYRGTIGFPLCASQIP